MIYEKKKGESLYAKCEDSIFTIWLLRNSENNQRNFGFICFFFFFYFGLCIEFLIELLKKIETLLFFEIELVCGFDFFIYGFVLRFVLRFVLFVG